MALTGYLSDFSLSELFKMLGQSRRTGLLTVGVLTGLDQARLERADPIAFAELGQAKACQAESGQAELGQAELGQAKAGQAESGQAKSGQIESGQTRPNFTQEDGDRAPDRARHLIWFYEGRVVAYVNRQGKQQFSALGDRLRQLPAPGERAIKKMQTIRPKHLPMGQWLQDQGLLQAAQLQELFREVVIHPISQLWSLHQGVFRFQSQARLPLAEMTGLSIPAAALTLASFRKLEDWSRWEGKLPDPQATLLKLFGGGSTALQLTPLELDVWREANGARDLATIARKIQQPLQEVQRVSFRLNHAGLIELSDASCLAVPSRRSRLSLIFSQVIGRVEARSPLAEPLVPVQIPSRILS